MLTVADDGISSHFPYHADAVHHFVDYCHGATAVRCRGMGWMPPDDGPLQVRVQSPINPRNQPSSLVYPRTTKWR
eukprot:m.424296 g.424296  ORF g.424296 m.424296 type:complete len:75 (+) comp46002_c0_seq1:1721-1945(+)